MGKLENYEPGTSITQDQKQLLEIINREDLNVERMRLASEIVHLMAAIVNPSLTMQELEAIEARLTQAEAKTQQLVAQIEQRCSTVN